MGDWNNLADAVVSIGARPPNEITVLFDNSTVTFRMPAETTLADLAARVTEQGGLQRQQMLAVTIKLGSADRAALGDTRMVSGFNSPPEWHDSDPVSTIWEAIFRMPDSMPRQNWNRMPSGNEQSPGIQVQEKCDDESGG